MDYCIERRLSGPHPVPGAQEVAAVLARAAAAALLTQPVPDQPVWHYENPRTRVAARITVMGDRIRLCLPLPRARFHLLEAEDLLARLGSDLQVELAPVGPDGDWATANRNALAGLGAGGAEYAYLPPERGEGWWRYLMARQKFRLAWPSADVVIPDLLLIQPRQGGPVGRLVIWPEDAGTLVLPEAEYIAIRRAPRLIPGGASQPAPGLIPWQAALSALADVLDQHQSPVPHWLYRGGDAHPFRIRSLLNQAGAAGAGYRPVAADRVVDVP